MGIMRVDHPDILDFIVCKEKEGILKNFNISVAVTDKFMNAVERDKDFELLNPRNKRPMKTLKARVVWNLILTMAWKNGEPGIIFIDTINKANTTPQIGEIESTNPCGEQPLLPFESCNLGSINLSKFVTEGKIDWERLKKIVKLSIRFLDNVIDANIYPIPEIERMTKANRKIGLGVMGFAEMLIQLGIPYNSNDGIKTAEQVMKFIDEEAKQASAELGEEKGSFENFHGSILEKKYKTMRNATVTTIAPAGTISVIGNCSSGIEPLFAVAYVRDVSESIGMQLVEINPWFEAAAIKEGFYNDDLIKNISGRTSIQGLKDIPDNIKKVFVTAHDISPEWHVRMQAAFQKYVDNAVSKTLNFPNSATPNDIEKVYMLAYKAGCKGITVYRSGSRDVEILKPIGGDQAIDATCLECNL
jgi:ribonucleoside-diphosphate reductase alpha chain